jgi:hypothetical protein
VTGFATGCAVRARSPDLLATSSGGRVPGRRRRPRARARRHRRGR